MFEKEAEEYAENNAYKYTNDYITCQEAYQSGAEFGYNKANEQLTLLKDILSLWEQTVCEIRGKIDGSYKDKPKVIITEQEVE